MASFINSNHLTEIHLNQINFWEELSKDLLYNKIEAHATDLLRNSDQRRAGCFPLDYILAVTVSRPHGALLLSSPSFSVQDRSTAAHKVKMSRGFRRLR